MKLLHVINIGHEAGGTKRSVRLIQRGMTARGHQMRTVATSLGSEGQELFADGLVPAIQGSAPQRFLGYFWHRDAHRRLTRIMDEFQPDVVHLHTIGEFGPADLAATADRSSSCTAPRTGRWNCCAGTCTPPPAVSVSPCRTRPATSTCGSSSARPTSRGCAGSTGSSRPVPTSPSSSGGTLGRVPVHVLPHRVPRTALPQPVKESGSLLYVGRLERVKGVHILLDAFRQLLDSHPEATLDIVGDGADRAELETSAADLTAAGRVRFRGWVPPDAVSEALAASSVVVIPSVWPENFPTVALEALRLLVGDRERLRRLGDGSAARAARYDVESFLDALEIHYREAISR